MSSDSHLRRGRLNLSAIRDLARRTLSDALQQSGSEKLLLVWDAALIGPFSLIAQYSFLQEHGVIAMSTLGDGDSITLPSEADACLFLVRPQPLLMREIASIVRRQLQLDSRRRHVDFHLLFVPSSCFICKELLQAEQINEHLTTIGECYVDLFPLDNDVLSMELGVDGAFRDTFLDEYPATIHQLADALTSLQLMYGGAVGQTYAKGAAAKRLVSVLELRRREFGGDAISSSAKIDTMIVLDRTVDLLSLLPMQLTFEGLIDELFGIKQNAVKVPADRFPPDVVTPPTMQVRPTSISTTSASSKKLTLNSADALYTEIRDLNFNTVGGVLSRRAHTLGAQMEERKATKTVGQMKEFVQKVPHLLAAKQALANYLSLAELIKERLDQAHHLDSVRLQQQFLAGVDAADACELVERWIAEQRPLASVLRLVALQCICGSLKESVWNHYRRAILHSYGFRHVVTLDNLERVGFFRQRRQWWPAARQALKLVVDAASSSSDSQSAAALGSVFGACVPLSVRLVQLLNRPGGWRAIGDAIDALPGGERVERSRQDIIGGGGADYSPTSGSSRRGSVATSPVQPAVAVDDEPRTTLVVFIGGVTFAEIGALRALSTLDDNSGGVSPVEYVVLTTGIVSGDRLMQSLSETLEAPPF